MKLFKFLLLGMMIPSLTGCVAVFAPKKAKIQLQSSQGEVTVSEQGEEVGKGTNVNYTLDKMRTCIHQVDIAAEGYKTQHLVIYPKRRMAIVWPVQLLYFPVLFFPSAVDLQVGSPFVFDKQIPIEPLAKLPTHEDNTKMVYFSGISFNEKKFVEDALTYSFKHKKGRDILSEIELAERESGSTDSYLAYVPKASYEHSEAQIYDYLRDNGFIDTVNTVFRDNNNSIWLEASVESYHHYEIDVKSHGNYYKGKATIKWYLRNTYDEVYDSIVRTDFSDDFTGLGSSGILGDIIENSYINLLNSKEFAEHMQANTDFAQKEAPLSIAKPKTPVASMNDAQLASVVVKSDDGHGSGFAISNDGYVLTNYHVISGEKKGTPRDIWIQRPDGGKTKAALVRFNEFRDLALLKVDTVFAKAFSLTSQKSYSTFKEVYTVGAPKFVELSSSYQKGVVSNDRTAFGMDYIQLSMAVNGGNSGGPLFDDKGVLCGVIVSKLIGFSTEGVGFAIPGHKIADYLQIKQ